MTWPEKKISQNNIFRFNQCKQTNSKSSHYHCFEIWLSNDYYKVVFGKTVQHGSEIAGTSNYSEEECAFFHPLTCKRSHLEKNGGR